MLELWCVFTDLAHDGNVQITVVFKRQSDCSEKKKKKHLLLFSVSVSVHCINKNAQCRVSHGPTVLIFSILVSGHVLLPFTISSFLAYWPFTMPFKVFSPVYQILQMVLTWPGSQICFWLPLPSSRP